MNDSSAPEASRTKQLVWVLVVLAIVLIADQVSKAIIIAKIPDQTRIPYMGEETFFRLTHQRNFGLVGGLFHEHPSLAYVLPFVACLVLVYLFWHLDRRSRLQWVSYGMIAGGAIGNIADRVRLGSVTDFLQFHFHFIPFNFPWKHYPAFNLADSAICTGVFLLMVSWYFIDKRLSHAAQSG